MCPPPHQPKPNASAYITNQYTSPNDTVDYAKTMDADTQDTNALRVDCGDDMGGKYEPSVSIMVNGGGIPLVGVLCRELFGDAPGVATLPRSRPLGPAAFSGDPSLDLAARLLFITK